MLTGELEPGGFLAFYRALMRLTWPLVALGFLVSMVQRGRAAYSRIADLYAVPPAIEDGTLALPEPAKGALDVRELGFAYGEQTVLDRVSFTLPPRSSLAIVGRTGSGKSTLAQLVARLLPTPRGAVWVDGVHLCDLPVSVVRQTVGYAEQSAFLFSTTIARNIGFTLDEPDTPEARQRIEAAARDAQILDELGQLPDELDTVVGERGVQLSGGQRQRVALGRALLEPKPVLLLDDPLSAVDASTAEALLAMLELERGSRTLVLITHRVAEPRAAIGSWSSTGAEWSSRARTRGSSTSGVSTHSLPKNRRSKSTCASSARAGDPHESGTPSQPRRAPVPHPGRAPRGADARRRA